MASSSRACFYSCTCLAILLSFITSVAFYFIMRRREEFLIHFDEYYRIAEDWTRYPYHKIRLQPGNTDCTDNTYPVI